MFNITKFKVIFGVLIPLFLVSCETNTPDRYTIKTFPETPVNLADFNTEYDDYNSAMPSSSGETFPFCFSSTRNSSGSDYDIVYTLMSIQFSEISGKLDVYKNTSNGLEVYIRNFSINYALNKINSTYNEFGPCLVPAGSSFDPTDVINRHDMYVFLYSNNSSGNQDIKFTHNLNDLYYEQTADVKFLNSEFDDAYPAFNKDFSDIYFTSNRQNSFDIYKASIDTTSELVDVLKNTSAAAIQKETILSSVADDKCPFLSNDMLVFTSNREGGYGGYDLYYSRFQNGNWGTPVNFGPKINTAADEYRPIIRPEAGFTNDFMIFSSNRPGGKGGFDLYYVGIDKIIKGAK
jgi:hypothetical protein